MKYQESMQSSTSDVGARRAVNKKTNLFEEHKALGGKIVEFAGFEMPVQYEGVIAEHSAVRNSVGIFDVSHMGEFLVSGKDASKFLNSMVPNNVSRIEKPGLGLYTQICNENGGTVDDLIIYNLGDNFLIVVNASNIEKDWSWFNKNKNAYEVSLKDISDITSLLALQGPNSPEVLSKVLGVNFSLLKEHKYFEIKKYKDVYIARTGYTGEDGFEIFIQNPEATVKLWKEFIKYGVKPCGLGARDTLRLEAVYPLYGHELTDEISPLEAGLGFSIKLDKTENFIGREILEQQKKNGLERKIVCLKVNDKLIARQGYKVFTPDKKEIGYITSGSQGITVGYPVATALLPITFSKIGTELLVQVREKFISCSLVPRPFYKRHG